MEERPEDPRAGAGERAAERPARSRRCALILVDLDAPEHVDAAALREPLERWGQGFRHAPVEVAPGVTAGDVHGCVVPLSAKQVVAILRAVRVR